MKRSLSPELVDKVFINLNEWLVVALTFTEHIEVLEEVPRGLQAASFTVNAKKCEFCRESIKYIGYILDRSFVLWSIHVTVVKRFMGMGSLK